MTAAFGVKYFISEVNQNTKLWVKFSEWVAQVNFVRLYSEFFKKPCHPSPSQEKEKNGLFFYC
jgi:hypothetical protein